MQLHYLSQDGAPCATVPISGTVADIPDGSPIFAVELGSTGTSTAAPIGGKAFAGFWETKFMDEEIRGAYPPVRDHGLQGPGDLMDLHRFKRCIGIQCENSRKCQASAFR